jgi:hypothetical protein
MGTSGSAAPITTTLLPPITETASTSASSESTPASSQASSPPASVAGDPEPPTESAVASAATTQVGVRMDINRLVQNVFPARYPDDIGKKATQLPPFTAFISGISQRAPNGTLYVTTQSTDVPAGKFPYVSLQNFIQWAKMDSEYNYQDQNRAVSNKIISEQALVTKITQMWGQVTPKGRKPAAAKTQSKASTSGT